MKVSATKVDLAHLAAVLLEVVAWKPGLRPELARDFERVQVLVESRGISTILVDFPKGGKVLDLALSGGRLFPDNLPVSFGKVSGQSRLLFRSLFRMIFNDSCLIIDDHESKAAVFFLRQILYMYKKVKLACPDEQVELAIKEFMKIEDQMSFPTNAWGSNYVSWKTDVSFLDEYRSYSDLVDYKSTCPKKLLGLFQVVCDRTFGSFPEVLLRDLQPRHGNGAVADARTGTDKYRFPFWPVKLEEVFPFHFFAQSREDMHHEEEFNSYDEAKNHEFPSKLIAVPKTYDKPRIIASEPVAHMYCQQAVLAWLRENLPATCSAFVNFKDQRPSQLLALKASLPNSGIATVDLSSASDRLSCWAVERALRRNVSLLNTLFACRTRWLKLELPVSGRTEWLQLRKYAPQGNATTFPIQTLIYLCAALASALYEDGLKPTTKNVLGYRGSLRVFGDDIILPSRAVGSLTQLLTHIGLKVNMGKTHSQGLFRESCGMDAFCGTDVSPCYLAHLESDSTADKVSSFVDVSNNAYNKGLWLLADLLVTQIPSRVRRKLVVSREPTAGLTLTTFQESPEYHNRRWNEKLHRWEVPALQVQEKTVQGERTTHRNLLQYFLESAASYNLKEGYRMPAILEEKNFKTGFRVSTSSKLKKTWVAVK